MTDAPFLTVIHYPDGHFAIESQGRCTPALSFDEAVFLFAAIWFGRALPSGWMRDGAMPRGDWQLVVTRPADQSDWSITDGGDRFISRLMEGEAFGFVVAYMTNGRGLFSGLLTYEQSLARQVIRSMALANLPYFPTPICCRPLT